MPTGTDVTLRLRAAQGDLTAAKLRLYNDRTNVQSILLTTVAYSDGTYDWWEYTIPASADPDRFTGTALSPSTARTQTITRTMPPAPWVGGSHSTKVRIILIS